MSRPPALPTPMPSGAKRALPAATRPTAPRPAATAAPRSPVLHHGRTPQQLSFAFHRV